MQPSVVSVEMGYGHLRAALPLADALGTEVLNADAPPLADTEEQRLWSRVRSAHELLSRPTALTRWLGDPRKWMDRMTNIEPLHGRPTHTRPNLGALALDWLAGRGLGEGLVQHLRETGRPLLTTFYAPAVIADRAGLKRVYCVATDADLNRVWAPLRGAESSIHYFAPSPRVVRRLVSYGVRRRQITLTGFPLPTELTGGEDLATARSNLVQRLGRLDPLGTFRSLHGDDVERALGDPAPVLAGPARLTFAVGGAGAQAEMAHEFLPALRHLVLSGQLQLNLVAGIRPEVAQTFERAIERARLGGQVPERVRIHLQPDFPSYYRAFNRLIAETDILWTKPSELCFYGALGLPLVLAKPVGSHERYNRRWLTALGVGLKQDTLRQAGGWLLEWLEDGLLAAAAWSGYVRMPKHGTHRIVEQVQAQPEPVPFTLSGRSARASA